MIKTVVYFVRELFHRLGQHPFAAVKKVLNPAIWKKLGSLAVGETVQPTFVPDLPGEIVDRLAAYAAASDKTPFVRNFLETHGRLVFPQVDHPRVSIVVPVYNQVLSTLYCLHGLIRNKGEVSFEVIVADDCSQDATRNLEDYVDHLRITRPRQNLGFLGNCNQAAAKARGEFLVFLNNDTYVQAGWLDELVREANHDESVGLIGSKLVYPDGSLQEAGGIIWNDGTGANFGRNDNPTKAQYNYVRDVDYLSGAAILLRRALFESIGGFDDRFTPAYYEDTDLAFEVRKRGLKVRYQPFSVVIHFEGVSHGTDVGSGIKQYQVENREKFRKKWQAELDREHKAPGNDWFHAREHRPESRTVLVIDRKTPTFDQDAGSRNTWQYTLLLQELGFKVLLLGDDFRGEQPYMELLQRRGIEVLAGSWFRSNIKTWLEQNLENIDYAYVNRPEIAAKYWPILLKFPKLKVVYHGHDLASLRTRRQYEVTGNKKVLAQSARWERLERKLFSEATTVLTVSQEEKRLIDEWTGEEAKTVAFPLYFYSSLRTQDRKVPFAERSGFLFIGGFTHAPNVDGAVWFVSEVLPQLSGRPRLTIVGAHAPQSVRALASDQVTLLDYVTDEELGELYNKSLVVVAPLRFGAGVKGKTIEAFWNGVPLVGTSTAYEGLGLDLTAFPVADTAEAFVREVELLSGSEENWVESAKRGEQVLSEGFTRERAVAVVKKVFW